MHRPKTLWTFPGVASWLDEVSLLLLHEDAKERGIEEPYHKVTLHDGQGGQRDQEGQGGGKSLPPLGIQ